MFQLKRIRPVYFRGFGNSDWINLNASLVVVHGPNGFGKTSLVEALEWLLYGKTKRRERGEALSARDYQGHYRNVHAPDQEPTFVEAVLCRLASGEEFLIKRELQLGPRHAETTRTFVAGAPFASLVEVGFDTIGLSSDEIFNPVVAQHSLQDLINSKPKERRDKIGATLGLDPIIKLKTAVDRARTSLQANPPASVNAAKQDLTEILQAMVHNQSTRPVSDRWRNSEFDLQRDFREIFLAAQQEIQSSVAGDALIQSRLDHRRDEVARRVFDTSSIRPPMDFQTHLQSIQSKRRQAQSTTNALTQALTQYLNSAVSQYSQELLNFWKAGLVIRGQAMEWSACPMCEAPTLSSAKRTQLQNRIDQNNAYMASSNSLTQKGRSTADLLDELANLLARPFPTFLSSAQRAVLLSLFSEQPDVCIAFLAVHDTERDALLQFQRSLRTLAVSAKNILTTASNAGTAADAARFTNSLQVQIDSVVANIEAAQSRYSRAYSSFDRALQTRISNSTAVKSIDALLAPIRRRQSVETIAGYQEMLAESLVYCRQVEDFIQDKQNVLFATRGQEINSWYDTMNPGARVRFSRMEPGTDNLTMWADSFGIEMNAISTMSQSQLNCLGLSIHFMRVSTSGNPYGFILLDDPVQSIDSIENNSRAGFHTCQIGGYGKPPYYFR